MRFSDVDYCLLASKELFEEIGFRKIDQGQYVTVGFESGDDNESSGKLKFKYWMSVKLAENSRCVKLGLAIKEED